MNCAVCGRPLASKLRTDRFDFRPLTTDDDAYVVLFDGRSVHVSCAPKEPSLAPERETPGSGLKRK